MYIHCTTKRLWPEINTITDHRPTHGTARKKDTDTPEPQRGRGTLIFSYIRRLGSFFFFVQKIEFHYLEGGGGQKNEICLGV